MSSKKKQNSYSPPQKLNSPESQREKNRVPTHLKSVTSKIKDLVNYHKKMNHMYKKIEKTRRSDDRKFIEGKNSSGTEEFGSNSKNYMSSEKYSKNYNPNNYQDFSKEDEENLFNSGSGSNNYESRTNGFKREENIHKNKKSDERLTDHIKSPTFLNVESQYLEKKNNESSSFKPKALEFEKISNYSSNFNTQYLSHHFLEKTENNFNEIGGVKKEQSKFLVDPEDFNINKDYKMTGG